MKSSIDEIRRRFDADVERFSNADTGQQPTVDSDLAPHMIEEGIVRTNPKSERILDIGCGGAPHTENAGNLTSAQAAADVQAAFDTADPTQADPAPLARQHRRARGRFTRSVAWTEIRLILRDPATDGILFSPLVIAPFLGQGLPLALSPGAPWRRSLRKRWPRQSWHI